jgi:hypothetical protein
MLLGLKGLKVRSVLMELTAQREQWGQKEPKELREPQVSLERGLGQGSVG